MSGRAWIGTVLAALFAIRLLDGLLEEDLDPSDRWTWLRRFRCKQMDRHRPGPAPEGVPQDVVVCRYCGTGPLSQAKVGTWRYAKGFRIATIAELQANPFADRIPYEEERTLWTWVRGICGPVWGVPVYLGIWLLILYALLCVASHLGLTCAPGLDDY